MQRWFEVLVLFIAAPIGMALFVDPRQMWVALLSAGLLGVVLLVLTKEFEWKSLLVRDANWRNVVLIGIITFIVSSVLCWVLIPDRLFQILRQSPWFLLLLSIVYPLVLVLPQELIYRPLFFKRYGHLFPNESVAVIANAILFSLAHLMYWHWVVLVLTFIGSFIFARAYLKNSFLEAMAYHSITGIAVFASGLGWLFYSGGNVVQ